MKTPRTLPTLLLQLALLATPFAVARSAVPLPVASRPVDPAAQTDATIELSPFEVRSDKDYGYAASQSLSGSRLAQELKTTPVAVTVITRELLDDIAAFSVQEAMAWSTNSFASNDSDPNGGSYVLGGALLASQNTAVATRGGAGQLTTARNFFRWSINSDSFNIERIDQARGPNALLFGDSALSGSMNVTTKRAQFTRARSLQLLASSFGGGRAVADINEPLAGKALAVRAGAFLQRTDTWRDFGKTDQQGAYLTATWRPRPGWEIRVEGEAGQRDDRLPATSLRSAVSAWNRTTVFDTPGSLTAAQATAAGLRRSGAVNVLTFGREQDGIVNWINTGDTFSASGTAGTAEPRLAAHPLRGTTLPSVSVLEPVRLDGRPVELLTPNYAYSLAAGLSRVTGHYHTGSIFVERRIGQNLFLEAAANLQAESRLNYVRAGNAVRIAVDVNRQLPAGHTINGSSANPNFLKYFTQTGDITLYDDYQRTAEARVLGVYRLQTRFAEQNFGVLASTRRADSGQSRFRLTRVNGPDANLAGATNVVEFRSYLDDRTRGVFEFERGPTYMFNGTVLDYVQHSSAGPNQHTDATVDSLQAFVSGSWFASKRLHTTLGIRRDAVESTLYNSATTGTFDATTRRLVRVGRTSSVDNTLKSPSTGAVLTVLPWLSLYANASKSFVVITDARLDYQGNTLPPPRGETVELGAKFEFFGGRVAGSLSRYKSEQTFNSLRINELNSGINAIATALNLPAFGAPFDSNSIDARGWEFEVTANPTRNWTLTVNAARPRSSTTGSFKSFRPFFAERESGWRAIATNVNNPASTAVAVGLGRIDEVFRSNSDGEETNGNFKLLGNAITRYRFTEGRLKGFSLGGGMNYFGESKIGRLANGTLVHVSPYALFTAFGGYRHKVFGHDLDWRLNVSNLFDDLAFRYVAVTTTGFYPGFRTATPREVRLSATVSF
ncbi:MAG: TonB-dependent receptor [Opitutaceae bacterium]|nr:TonB-dependent receptor [Opitutaceae bacterium]